MALPSIQQSFSIDYRYTLHFTSGVFSPGNDLFAQILHGYKPEGPTKILFVLDEGLLAKHPHLQSSISEYCNHHSHILQDMGHLIVEGGEGAKNKKEYVDQVLEAINSYAICRHSFVVAIGGGAVIDMAGYAATIAHRGVKLIRIPTTVLAQNDAAVGVKNGINHFNKKNFLGTFAPPYAIINDSAFLETLDQRDWIAGVAEAIKVALIKDRAFFHFLEEHATRLKDRDMEVMNQVIHRCAEIHMDHIAGGGDPFESGSSRPLDFGHWAAHKLEQMSGYSLKHGEAVAKGMALDVTYARLMGMIPKETLNIILSLMEAMGFDLRIGLGDDFEIQKLLRGIEEFREHLGGRLTITLITGIGMKHDVHEIDLETMKQALLVLNERYTSNVV